MAPIEIEPTLDVTFLPAHDCASQIEMFSSACEDALACQLCCGHCSMCGCDRSDEFHRSDAIPTESCAEAGSVFSLLRALEAATMDCLRGGDVICDDRGRSAAVLNARGSDAFLVEPRLV